ncbi:MAG: glucose-6-phosphate isomerase [Desulfobacteraceae bacterium]|nr:glucose-6-phosphate isomerase [Desulfobacteraceae bacterium]
MSCSYSLGKFQADVDHALQQIKENNILSRIWSHDHTVWKDDPAEISNRLGWLHSPEKMTDAVDQITAFVEEVRGAGFTHALLLGMGGSSLAPEVLRCTFGVKDGYLNLAVLDSTDPEAVLEKMEEFDVSKTLYIVSTKSGGTVETASFMKFFYNEVLKSVGADKAGEHFIAITDPGSSLEATAKELKFKKVFLNDPNIGGRYSALSYFGLVPAALIGMDLTLMLERAAIMAQNTASCNGTARTDNSAALLGAAMGELAIAGRDKVTLIISPPVSYFGAWVEQLIAESTGKEGKGILPVSGETVSSPDKYGHDRLFIYLRLNGDDTYDASVQALRDDGRPVIRLDLRDQYDLCGEFFRWEMAAVIAGMCLGINPFDQPDVESAKVLAREMVAAYHMDGKLPRLTPDFQSEGISVYSDLTANSIAEVFLKFLSLAQPGEDEAAGRSYIAVQAYIMPHPETDEALKKLQTKIQQHYRLAVTVGYGPRFLHSTGQLHKGDGGNGLFIQLTADLKKDLPIPDQAGGSTSSISFGVLKNAQARGDRQALLDAGRQVIRFHLGSDIAGALRKLVAVF